MHRIAVIGAGGHSRHNHGAALARYCKEHPGRIELTAVCDPDQAQAAAYASDFGFKKTFASHEEMLAADAPDAVLAILPIPLTREIAGDLLERRQPVLIEKPVGESLADAEALCNIHFHTQTPHMVSLNRRFSPALTRAREWLQQDSGIRTIRQINARMLRGARREPEFITGTGIHLVDAVSSFLPNICTVTAIRNQTSAGGQTAAALLQTDGGQVASINIYPDCGRHAETYEIFGDDLHLLADVDRCALDVFVKGKQVLSWTAPNSWEDFVRNGTYNETRVFLENVVMQMHPAPPQLKDALHSMRLAAAIDAGGMHRIDPRKRQVLNHGSESPAPSGHCRL